MSRHQRILTTISCTVALFSSLGLGGCKRVRPANAPRDSVYVEGGEAGWWQHCSYDPSQDIDHCQVFNLGGAVLYDEVFLPYDGGTAAKASELNIDGSSNLSGPNIVCLKNSRILIPKSNFERLKLFIDSRLKGR